jgi:hypothetical protein
VPVTIYPYLYDSTIWVFDDERAGLKQEAFVSGASEMISRVVEQKRLPNAATGISLTFSDQPIERVDVELHWLRKDENQLLMGNWYRGRVADQEMECWLCPALFLYFATAPARLFVRADPLPLGVDPIWHVDLSDPRQRRFVSPDDAE